jgi:hypothetical protein
VLTRGNARVLFHHEVWGGLCEELSGSPVRTLASSVIAPPTVEDSERSSSPTLLYPPQVPSVCLRADFSALLSESFQ